MEEDNVEELLVTENLTNSLNRVKAMVKILYVKNTLTLDSVQKIAQVAKFRLKVVSEEPKNTELAFTSLEEVVDFLISCIL